MTISQDLRIRLVQKVADGISCRRAAALSQIAPTLSKGDVVVLDNLPAHKRDSIKKIVQKQEAWLLFLPPYSPDFNPIELAF